MKMTKLEKTIIESMIGDSELTLANPKIHLHKMIVTNREFTGAGFFTEIQRSPDTRLFDEGLSMHWGRVGARLNADAIKTGYLVYVEDGYVTLIEGYTYGDEWPTEMEGIELYPIPTSLS